MINNFFFFFNKKSIPFFALSCQTRTRSSFLGSVENLRLTGYLASQPFLSPAFNRVAFANEARFFLDSSILQSRRRLPARDPSHSIRGCRHRHRRPRLPVSTHVERNPPTQGGGRKEAQDDSIASATSTPVDEIFISRKALSWSED